MHVRLVAPEAEKQSLVGSLCLLVLSSLSLMLSVYLQTTQTSTVLSVKPPGRFRAVSMPSDHRIRRDEATAESPSSLYQCITTSDR